MRARLASAAPWVWLAWGLLQWAAALTQAVFMRGFFPPAADAVLAARPLLALAAALMTAAGSRPRAGLAAAAAAAAMVLTPGAGGGGARALTAAVLAWLPAAAAWRAPLAVRRAAGADLAGSLAAAGLTAGAWAAAGGSPRAALPLAALAAADAGAAGLGPLAWPAAAAALSWTLDRVLLETLGLSGAAAALFALPAGAAGAAALTALGAAAGARPAPVGWAAAAACAFGSAALARLLDGLPDWSRAAQSLVLLWGWAGASALARAAVRPPGPREVRAAAAALALALAAAGAARSRPAPRGDALGGALARVLAPRPPDEPLFRELWARMGRPDRTAAAWVLALPPAAPRAGARPDVYILVVDSLRPDFLGAYGSSDGLSPALDALADGSLVFRRAFTPYGGTHLAVPGLWAGALVPHGPLPVPFAPVSALERLFSEAGYRLLVAPDVHTRMTAQGPPLWETFDEGHEVLRPACAALPALAAKLARAPGRAPVFAYAHLFDLHIARVGEDDFSGRGASGRTAYAAAVRRVDACLGAFVAALKAKGLWDDAVLVVTADHGDSLGEDGRWGHAHTAYPEVLRVPLVVRVPPRVLGGRRPDLAAPAFLTDVAPTLADLLGRRPWPAGPEFGRSLLGPARGASALVASSYAPVFGLVDAAGRRLFLADAVDRALRLYDMPETGPARALPMDAESARRATEELRAVLEAVDRQRAPRAQPLTQSTGKAVRRT